MYRPFSFTHLVIISKQAISHSLTVNCDMTEPKMKAQDDTEVTPQSFVSIHAFTSSYFESPSLIQY